MNTSKHTLYRKGVSYLLLAVMIGSSVGQPLYAAVYANPLDKWLSENIEQYKNTLHYTPSSYNPFSLAQGHDEDAETIMDESTWAEDEKAASGSAVTKNSSTTANQVTVTKNRYINTAYKAADNNTVYADIASGFIGQDSKTGIADDPSDNVFHFDFKTISPTDAYVLTYEIKGIENASGVITALNENPAQGGKLIKTSDSWVQHTKQLDKNQLKTGFNYVLFNAPSAASVPYQVKNVRIERVPKTEQVVQFDEQPGHFYFHGTSLYVKGKIQQAYAGYELRINNQTVHTTDGYFDTVIPFEAAAPETLSIQCYKGSELVYSKTEDILSLTKADHVSGITANRLATRSAVYEPQQAYTLNAFEAGIELPAHTLDSAMTISISQLRSVDMAPFGGALFNVTKNRLGYRFLPDGLTFSTAGKIAVPYAKEQLPAGYSEADIQLFYFDVYSKSWQTIPTAGIDTEKGIIYGTTDHFTDYIAGIIQVPQSPETAAFTPTTISDIQIADPSEGIVEIQPPTANQQGDGTLSYPINVPPGRNGLQPQLALQYNNNGGNGWMGQGWELSVPSIEIDTRFGVPPYSTTQETEAYTLMGEELMLNTTGESFYLPHRDNLVSRISNAKFYPKTEGSFSIIERRGTGPANYNWVVRTKDGMTYYYGETTNSRLTTGSGTTGNIARWLLTRMVDSNGNEVNYTYETKTFSGGTVAGGKQIYLKSIMYSGGFHTITFERTLNVGTTARTDIGISYRLGFKEITYDLLSKIKVDNGFQSNGFYDAQDNYDYYYRNITYALNYTPGAFGKTLLANVVTTYSGDKVHYGAESTAYPNEVLTHSFDYYNDAVGGLFESNSISMASPNDHQGKYEEFGVTATAIGGGEGKTKQLSGSFAPGIVYVGLPASYLPISNAGTVYYSPSRSESETETMVSLIDMDGDGLPDKLFKTGGKLKYRKNMGYGFSDYVVPVEGDLGRMVYSTSKTTSKTGSVNIAIGGIDISESNANNRVHSYFEDVNADGLIDMVQNGTVLFNRIDPNTRVPVYSNTSLNTPNVIRKEGDVHPDAINALPPLDNSNSLMDLVKVWKAPATGKINITGTITKNHVSLPNGVRYSIEKRARTGGTVLSYQMTYIKEPSLMLVGSEGTNFTNIEVKKGDMLFFRVNTTHIPEEDVEVTWSPRVTYTTSNFDSPNRYKQYSSSYDEAFIMSMGADYVIKQPGTYYVNFPAFTINNSSATAPELSDDVFFKYTVYKINQNVSSGQNPMQVIATGQKRAKPNVNNTISLPNTVINGAGVNENDGDSYIYVKVEAVAYSEVNWKLISEKFRPYIVDTTGQKNYITPSLRNYANTHTNYYHSNFDNTGVGIVVLNNFNLANYGCSDGSCKDQYVYLVFKNKYGKIRNYMSGDMKIRYKIGASGNVVECFRFERNSGEYVDNFNPNEKQALTYITEDQDVYVEMYTDEYALAQKLRNYQQDHNFIELSGNNAPGKTTYVEGGTTAQNRGLYKLNIYSGTNTKGFGPFYRHWGQFAYKGPQPGEAFEKIDYDKINLEALTAGSNISEEGQSTSNEDLQALMDADPSIFENMTYEELAAQYPAAMGVSERLGVLMPDSNKRAWAMNDRLFVQNEKISPYTRYMPDEEIPVPPLNIYDNDNLYGAVGIIKTSRNESKSNTISFGFGNFNVANTTTKSNNFVYNDHRDINGDGYPDIVGEKIQLTSNKGGLSNTLLNTNVLQNSVTDGSGQAAGGGMAQVVSTFGMNGSAINGATRVGNIGFSMGISGQGFDSTDKANQTVIDINGDGLADIIQQNGTVLLNTGTTFVAQNSWGTTFANTTSTKTKSGGISGGGGFGSNGNFSNADIAFGLSISTSDTKEQDTYFDVNGDGLPDQITGGGTVRINTGSGFSTQTYALPQAMMQSSSNAGISANGTGCFTFLFPPAFVLGIKICAGVGGAKGHVVNQEKVRYMDMNGDGYPDLVTSENDDLLNVRLSRIRRTNMLKTVHRPMGGTLTLDYSTRNGYANTEVGSTFKMPFKKWVLSRVEVNDGVSGDGQDVMKYAFEYEGGFKDRRERKFMGFGTVKTHQLKADGSIYRSNITEYWLSQMKDTEPYLPSQHADIRKYQYLKDVVIREYTQDEYQRIPNEKIYSYDIKQARIPALDTTEQPYEMNGSSFTNFTETSRVVPLVAQIKTITRNFDEDNGNAALEQVHIERFKEYDKFGNPLVYIDDTDNVTASMSYHYNFNKYNVITVKEHLVESNAPTRWAATEIDANNNIVHISKYLRDDQIAHYDMEYNSYGNLIKITYPKGRMSDPENTRMWYQYSYDTYSNTFVNQIEDAYGYTSRTITDLWGRPLVTTDPNKKKIYYFYDALGRLALAGTGPDTAPHWLIKNEYYPRYQTGQFSYAITRHNIGMDNIPLVVSTSAFADGIGRVIQTKKQLEKDCIPATNDGYRFAVSGRVDYDEFGRAVDTFLSQEAKSCTSGTPETFLRTFTPLTHTANEKTTNRYDHRDRITQTRVHGLDATTRIKYAFGNDGFGKVQFTEDVVLPEGNRTITYKDIKGRTTTTKQIGDGQELQTLFAYDGLSQLKQVRDAADQVTSYEYDALGRKVMVKHPTSGQSVFTYDLADRLVKSQNEKLMATGEEIRYVYHFNQLTAISYPSHDVEFRYGAPSEPDNGAGRLMYQRDLTGTQTFKYNDLGFVKENTRTITDENGQVMEFVTQSKYDAWGRILGLIYPDGEQLTYTYNSIGQLTAIGTSEAIPTGNGTVSRYLSKVTYNFFDQPTLIEYSNGMKTKNEYDITQRLRAMQLSKGNQSVVMRNVYDYDRNQNVTRIDNNYSQANQFFAGGTYKNDYVYDGFNRLKSANGSWAGYQRTDNYSLNMSYTSTHGIAQKKQFHHTSTLTSSDETENSYDAVYGFENHPHRPDNIKYADHNGNAIGSKSIKYDANGNMEYIGTSDAFGNVEREMLWDEQNRLIGVIDNDNFYNQYIYDAGGERVLKKAVAVSNVNINGSQAITIGSFEDYTLYPSGYLVVGPNRYTKHYYANGKKIASKMVEMPTNVFLQSANFSRIPGENENDAQQMAMQQATTAAAQASDDNMPNMQSFNYVAYSTPQSDASCQNQITTLIELYTDPEGLLIDCKNQIVAIKNQYPDNPCLALELIHQIECVAICPDCPPGGGNSDPECPTCPEVDPNPEPEPTPDEELTCLQVFTQYYDQISNPVFWTANPQLENCYNEVYKRIEADYSYCELVDYIRNNPDICEIKHTPSTPEPDPDIPEEGEDEWEGETPVNPTPTPELPPSYVANVWWYHSDHLGSSSYLSDNYSRLSHYYYYLPFGETMVEQNFSGYNNAFKFNGKEQDPETGMYYYGARYYDPKMSLFISVDPLSEQFVGWSPYHYVHNNPINMVDPTGMSAEPPPGKFVNGYVHTDKEGSWTYNSAENYWVDNTGRGNDYAPSQVMNEMTIETNSSSISASDVLDYTNNAFDFSGIYFKHRNNFQGGSFRLYKNLKKGKVWSPKYYANNFGAAGKLKHTTYNVSKVLSKGTAVTSILLETPDIINGIQEDGGIGRNTSIQTAGAIGSILGGIWIGGKAGAAASAYTGNPWIIGGATIGGAIIGGTVGESSAEAAAEAIPQPSYKGPPIQNKR